MEPILRWVGSKRSQAKGLASEFIKHPIKRYIEPFLGSASVALALVALGHPSRAMILGDGLDSLIELYQSLTQETEATIRAFEKLAKASEKKDHDQFYAKIRSEINHDRKRLALFGRPELGAKFLYIMARGFNGLVRQNKDHNFNMSSGKSGYQDRPIRLPSAELLRQFATELGGARFVHSDFEAMIQTAEAGDLVYCDPPYDGVFTGYSTEWQPNDQKRLSLALSRARERGARVYASNADTANVRELYGWAKEIRKRSIRWQVAAKEKARKDAAEVLIIG
jgi:DNA adenine methylase